MQTKEKVTHAFHWIVTICKRLMLIKETDKHQAPLNPILYSFPTSWEGQMATLVMFETAELASDFCSFVSFGAILLTNANTPGPIFGDSIAKKPVDPDDCANARRAARV